MESVACVMEQHMLPIYLATMVILIVIYCKWTYSYWKRRKVFAPSPRIPFGNIPNPFFSNKQHIGISFMKIYYDSKRYNQLYAGFYWMFSPYLLAIHPQFIRQVLTKDFTTFADRNLYYNEKYDPISSHLLSVNGDRWRNLRTKLTPTFTSGKIKMMFKIFTECAHNLENMLESYCTTQKPVMVKSLFSGYTIDVIGSCAFGLEVNSVLNPNSEFIKNGQEVVSFDFYRTLVLYFGSLYPNLLRFIGVTQIPRKNSKFFMEIVHEIVEQRKTNNIVRNDFLQLLINIYNNNNNTDNSFTMNDLAAQCFVFFIAGFETSATTMSFALYQIVKNPDVERRVRQEIDEVSERYGDAVTYESVMEMKYLGQVISETLRMHSPAYYLSRVCTKNFTVPETGVVIDKGTGVIVPIRALHFDPEFYPDPEKFDPERFNEANIKNIPQYTYLPFGDGPRNCIGMRFAILETKVALFSLLKAYRFTINAKTKEPFEYSNLSFLLDPVGGIWLNCHKL